VTVLRQSGHTAMLCLRHLVVTYSQFKTLVLASTI